MTQQLLIRTTRAGPETIVSLEGELNVATADAFRAALMAAVSLRGTVVVDMARLSYMDASGLGVLMAGRRRCAAAGCRLVLRQPTRIVEMLLNVTNATSVLAVEPAECQRAESA